MEDATTAKKCTTKRKIALFCILGILILVVAVGFFINGKINKIQTLSTQGNFEEIQAIMNDPVLKLPLIKDIAYSTLANAAEKYKVENLNDFAALSATDWGELKNFDALIKDLDIEGKDTRLRYIRELYDLKGERDKVNAVKWYNSGDYNKWMSLLDFDVDNLEYFATLLENYSFSAYLQNCSYILEMDYGRASFAKCLRNISYALSVGSESNLNSFKNDLQLVLAELESAQQDILIADSRLRSAIAALPKI